MSFDGIFTYGILQELSETLVSGRISKIYQPFPNELILQVRAKGENRKLLISAHLTIHAFILQMSPMKIHLNLLCFVCFFANI